MSVQSDYSKALRDAAASSGEAVGKAHTGGSSRSASQQAADRAAAVAAAEAHGYPVTGSTYEAKIPANCNMSGEFY